MFMEKQTKDIQNTLAFILTASLFFACAGAVMAACDPNWPMYCNPTSSGTVAQVLIVIIKFLLSIIGTVSLLYIIVGGVKYILSAGNQESITSAKNTLTSAITGLAVALTAYAIVKAMEQVLTVK